MDEGTSQKVRAAIEQIGPLPVLDRTVRRVCALAEVDSADLELISTIERDETFAVNLLRSANSEAVVPEPTQPDAPLLRRINELERAAHIDSLTGVANRGHWFTFVGERLAAGRPGAVFVCDIDFLKQVNDTHGHAAGDEFTP